jgi:hypothetical protein
MKNRTIKLAEQLLSSVPKDEVADLIGLLEYYNRFPEEQRVKAMKNGSVEPKDKFLETQVIEEMVNFSKELYKNNLYKTCSICDPSSINRRIKWTNQFPMKNSLLCCVSDLAKGSIG